MRERTRWCGSRSAPFIRPEPPLPIMNREALAAAAARQGFNLVIDGARGNLALNQPAPIWRLGHATKRQGETVRLFPLAGWTEADVRARHRRRRRHGLRAADLPCASPLRRRRQRQERPRRSALGSPMRRARPTSASFIVDDVPGQDRDPRGVADRRVDCGPQRHPGRRPQGRAQLQNEAPLLPRVAARDPIRWSWWSTRWTSSTTRRCGRLRPDRAGLPRELCRKAARPACSDVHPDLGDPRRQRWRRLPATAWYHGPTLLGLLDRVEVDETRVGEQALRMPVQWVNRPSPQFRGFAGTIAAGRVRRGEDVRVQPSGHTSRVARIVTYDGDLEQAGVGQSITISIDGEMSPRGATDRRRGPAGGNGRPVRSDGGLAGGGADAARPRLSVRAAPGLSPPRSLH